MLPPANDVSNLPAAAKASILACQLKFVAANRGHVQDSNNKSTDARSKFFAGWLQTQGHMKQSVAALTQNQVIDTIGAFLDIVV
jgi:hypothetical protein